MHPVEPRKARIGPPSAGAAKVDVPIFREDAILAAWINLGNRLFPNPFFASFSGRLTPESGAFPCLYLAASHKTAVAEIWGDRLTLARDAGESIFQIRKTQAEPYEFRRVTIQLGRPRLQLCNLNDPGTRLALGLESGTLYSPEIGITRAWAQMIAAHRGGFDGILYSSRLTGEPCVVLWTSDRRPRIEGLDVERESPFLNSPHAYELAGSIGIRLAFM
jgi:hypothetical protein